MGPCIIGREEADNGTSVRVFTNRTSWIEFGIASNEHQPWTDRLPSHVGAHDDHVVARHSCRAARINFAFFVNLLLLVAYFEFDFLGGDETSMRNPTSTTMQESSRLQDLCKTALCLSCCVVLMRQSMQSSSRTTRTIPSSCPGLTSIWHTTVRTLSFIQCQGFGHL